jgi:hypothetical protein
MRVNISSRMRWAEDATHMKEGRNAYAEYLVGNHQIGTAKKMA